MEYIIFFALIMIILFFVWQNNSIVITNINYKNKKISKEFNLFKILHISDLHNKKFGKNQDKIIKKIVDLKPDVVVVTGDSIDCHLTKPKIAYKFLERISKIFPVYLISGNHEHMYSRYNEFIEGYKNSGAVVIDDNFIEIKRKTEKIRILGISDDKATGICYIDLKTKNSFENKLKSISNKCIKDEFNILLSHRPELIDLYEKYKFDLVLSGHAHGGQFRCGFIKGVIAPGQGFFPKYTSGLYTKGKTSMIVSRGLGNSVIPIRIFNRPELVVINLEK